MIALDKVQKRQPLSEDEFKSLKAKKLIEGRRPNLFVSAAVAAATDTKADYISNRAFDKEHYQKMVVELLGEVRAASAETSTSCCSTSSRTLWTRTEEELHHQPAARDAARGGHPAGRGKARQRGQVGIV